MLVPGLTRLPVIFSIGLSTQSLTSQPTKSSNSIIQRLFSCVCITYPYTRIRVHCMYILHMSTRIAIERAVKVLIRDYTS
jgi:hypothetical protein